MKSDFFVIKAQPDFVQYHSVMVTTSDKLFFAGSFSLEKHIKPTRYGQSSNLPVVSSASTNVENVQLYSSCVTEDFVQQELLSFLDFLDEHFTDDNIISADEEQLMRIASLVDGVEFE